MEEKNVKIINTVCPRNCYGACSLELHVSDGKIVKVKGGSVNPATSGVACPKGLSYFKLLDHKNRLLHPLKRIGKRGENKFEKITWDEAANIIHTKFTETINEHGPKSILYYSGSGNHGGVMEKYAYGFWYQLGGFSKTRGNLCDPAGNTAIQYTYGAKRQNFIADIANSKLIIIWGKNPVFTNIHTVKHINQAAKNGAKIVMIDPRINESSNKSDLHISPRCGTDGLLAICITKLLIDEDLIDKDFVEKHVLGFDEYAEEIEKYSMEKICEITDVKIDDYKKLIAFIKANPHFTILLGKGLQRYSNGGQTTRAICVLPALTGSVGKSGAGLYFNDGQRPIPKWPYYPNKPKEIRDDFTMGRIASDISTRTNPPVKAMWIERANPVVSNPNQNKLIKAMKELDFIVCLELFMTDTAMMADLVLPVKMFLEENDITISYGHSYIQLKQKAVDAPKDCKSDWEIYHLLGKKFNFDMQYLPKDDEEILDNVIKASGYKTTLQKMRSEPYLFPEYRKIAYEDLVFPTKSGKIELYSQSIADDWHISPLPKYVEPLESKYSDKDQHRKYPLQFMSAHARGKINSQFNESQWIKDVGEPLVYINENDAKKRNILDGDIVRVYNDRGEILVKANVGLMIKQGVINVFAGWENSTKAAVNKLTEDRETDIGYGAAFHNCLVEIERLNN